MTGLTPLQVIMLLGLLGFMGFVYAALRPEPQPPNCSGVELPERTSR